MAKLGPVRNGEKMEVLIPKEYKLYPFGTKESKTNIPEEW